MEQQRKRAQDARVKHVVTVEDGDLNLSATEFTGFDNLKGPAMVKQVIPVDDGLGVVLDKSPFYVEMGGQVGDSGTLRRGDEIIAVRDTQKMAGGIVHLIDGSAKLSQGDVVDAAVDADRRCAIERHHTVTHLLHWALREVLGKDASQRGSFVGADYLRFDFNHHSGLKKEEVAAVENLVNARIMENAPVFWTEQDRESIRGNAEINQFFGDKYGDSVRVVQIGGEKGALNGYSMELCGGTHTSATGIIGPFVLRHEAAISAGIRRIEAIAGNPARSHVNAQLALLDRIGQSVGSPIADLEKRIDTMLENQKRLEKELKAASAKLAQSAAGDLLSQVADIGGVSALVADVSALDASPAELLDSLQSKFQDGIIVLGGAGNGACSFACAVPNDLVKQGHNAGTLAREAAKVTGGGGGGSPQKAKAGGRDATKLADALEKAREVIASTGA
jgi:alanyl-tRNA synthetase